MGDLSSAGWLATMSLVGSVTTDVFWFYTQERLMPHWGAGALLVLAHLPGQHARLAREAMEAGGAKVGFLPPASPALAPIERGWSKLKPLLRSAQARTQKALDQALTQRITDDLSAEETLGWFNHCGLCR